MKPGTRKALLALSVTVVLPITAILFITASPRQAIQILNRILRESWSIGGFPAPSSEGLLEVFLSAVPRAALKANRRALPALIEATENPQNKFRTRVICAEIALEHPLQDEQRDRLKRTLLSLAQQRFQYRGHLLLAVLPLNFGSEPDVREFLLATARKEQDLMLIRKLLDLKIAKNTAELSQAPR